ncbi:hypothetical protein BvCmsNSP006_02128 [Escherichia coli]|nr:hypothetical protein BvCmsNSP006_02128 [Escherichia coli]
MKQITFAPRNHLLTNTNTWTPDSQWLVFDVRPSGASFTGETIERVNIHYSAAIFLIPICISFDTAEKRRYATYLILNRRFSFEF